MTAEGKQQGHRPAWGLLPGDVIDSLHKKQWQSISKRKCLLKGESSFPLQISLKPPRGNVVLGDLQHFRNFVARWRRFSEETRQHSCEVFWQSRTFRSLAEQVIPTVLSIPNVGALAALLGDCAVQQLKGWQSKIAYLLDGLASLSVDDNPGQSQAGDVLGASKEQLLFVVLIDYLDALESWAQSDMDLLITLIPQLKPGMGQGCYLRALPVTCVDTKFVENNRGIIAAIAAVLVDQQIQEIGLVTWLHCKEKPKSWLLIKPLCPQTRAALGGMPQLRLASDTLLEFPLPAGNILIIENEQSCLALNNVADTIAVSGGGKNIAWMGASWLANKKVGYWGDIDSEGLTILSDARSKLSTITPLMMDSATVEAYGQRMVDEPDSVVKEPAALTTEELELFRALRAGRYGHTRLEQERLPLDYVSRVIEAWMGVLGGGCYPDNIWVARE